MADQFTRRLGHALIDNGGGNSIQYLYAPALPGSGVGGTAVTPGAGAWGAYVDFINGGGLAVTTEYWVAGFAFYTSAGAQVYEVQIYNLTLTRTLANFNFDLTAATVNMEPLLVPYPIYCAAATNIQMRAGGAAANAINCNLIYIVGL